ncbi:MAG: SDR family oxidoreductase [Flavipsychrobacter sp.]
MILVTGANGHFGSTAINFLIERGYNKADITALVRSEEKGAELKAKGIAIRIGDYDNTDSLVAAFQGIDKLLLVSGTDLQNRTKQQTNAVNAAKQAGVKHIIYTSFERKNETESSPIAMLGSSHIQTEAAIKQSGIPYTILRNNLYLEFLPMVFGEKIFETGVFYPAGDGRFAPASRIDMAEIAANILMQEGHENKEYVISGTETVSFREIASALSSVAGKEIAYISPDKATYIAALTGAGVPEIYAGLFAGFAEAIQQGELIPATTDIEKILGRKPQTMEAYIKTVYGNK